jgi:hypothetical protein
MENKRTYKQQLADMLRRKEHAGWTGQVTRRGYPSEDRAEVVAELFAPNSPQATKTIILQHGR